MAVALPVDALVQAKGLRPTITFREDLGSGIVYCATSRSFFKVTLEELQTLRCLSKGQEDVWLASTTSKAWTEAGWIGPEGMACPFAEKLGRTMEQPFRPLHALIIATLKCNASCDFCSARPYMKAHSQKEFYSAEQAKLLAQQLHALGVMQCVVSGGEPTLFRYLDVLIHSLVRHAIFPTVVSNGTIWPTEQYIRNYIEGVSWMFSYHSDDPFQHDAIMNLQGAHKKVSKILKGLSRAGLTPRVNVVISNFNRPRLEAIIESLSKLGVRDILLSQHLRMGRSREIGLHPSVLGDQAETLARWRSRGVNISTGYRFRFLYEPGATLMQELFTDFSGGCPAGLFESLIFPDGAAYPCDYLWEDKFCAGNLFEGGGIQRIITSPIFSMLHRLPADKACIDCRYLKVCKGGCPGVRYMLEGQLAYPNPECPLLEAKN